jgi:hypothetical protein
MTHGNHLPAGEEPAAQALLGYMKWFSEERWCAGWLIGLDTEIGSFAAGPGAPIIVERLRNPVAADDTAISRR